MKISIIVPVYNAEKYIVGCLDSLIHQTHTDIEIILVNDGSEDSSGAICDAYAQNDNRIKVIHKSNAGVAAARNTGMDAATGEYVTFCDSDDTVNPEYVEKLCLAAKEEDADIVICDFVKVSNRRYPFKSCSFPAGTYDKKALTSLYFSNLIAGNGSNDFIPSVTNSCSGKLFRKPLLISNRKYFFEDISHGEDKLVVLSCLLDAQKIVYLKDEYLYFYQMIETSITHTYRDNMLHQYTLLEEHILFILQQKNVDIPEQMELLYVCNLLSVLSGIFTMFGKHTINHIRAELQKLQLHCRKKPFQIESDFQLSYKQKICLFCLKHNFLFFLLVIGKIIYLKNKLKRRYSHG